MPLELLVSGGPIFMLPVRSKESSRRFLIRMQPGGPGRTRFRLCLRGTGLSGVCKPSEATTHIEPLSRDLLPFWC